MPYVQSRLQGEFVALVSQFIFCRICARATAVAQQTVKFIMIANAPIFWAHFIEGCRVFIRLRGQGISE